jgi:hypothetical protein
LLPLVCDTSAALACHDEQAYEGSVFQEEGVLDKILASNQGSYTTASGVPASVPHSILSQWDLTSPAAARAAASLQPVSYVW